MTALKMTNELLQILPDHERANGNKVFYEKHLAEDRINKPDKKMRGDDGSTTLSFDVEVYILIKTFTQRF